MCFFFGAIISSVVALQTTRARPCPAKAYRAAFRRSFSVCPEFPSPAIVVLVEVVVVVVVAAKDWLEQSSAKCVFDRLKKGGQMAKPVNRSNAKWVMNLRVHWVSGNPLYMRACFFRSKLVSVECVYQVAITHCRMRIKWLSALKKSRYADPNCFALVGRLLQWE